MDSTAVHCTCNVSYEMSHETLESQLLKCPNRPKHYNNLDLVPKSELEVRYRAILCV